MKYGPISYASLSRVYPRDALREPFPWQRYRRLLLSALLPRPTLSIYTQIAQGVEGLLAALDLAGTQTLLLKFPTDRESAAVLLPCQQATLGPANERAIGSLNGANDWEYPVLLTLMQADDQDLFWDANFLAWRRQIERLFHNKRPLPLLSCNPLFRVDPAAIVDSGCIHDENLAIGQLLLWARTREDRTAPPTGPILSGDPFVYGSIGVAVKNAIESLSLPQVTQVVVLKIWTDRAAVQVDLSSGWTVFVSTPREPERELGPMNYRDDWVWPVLVTIVRASDQNLVWDDAWFLARQTIRDAFHNQPLAGVSTVWKCEVEPQHVIDPGPFHDQNLDIGQLLIRVRSRERRY